MSKRDSTQRARSIEALPETLDEEAHRGDRGKWAVESEERIDAVERGELQTVDGLSALRDLRSCLQKRPKDTHISGLIWVENRKIYSYPSRRE